MQKLKTMQKITESGIIAVVRGENAQQVLKTVEAIRAGGIKIIEITMTVPRAKEIIQNLVDHAGEDDLLIGAGSVLDAETAQAVISAGAGFVVSPITNIEMIRLCNRYQIVNIPGAMSINEIVGAMEAGGDFIKLFPGNVFSPEIVKSIKGPLPYVPLIPTGGVNMKNVKEWLSAGCEAVGIGGELTKGAKEGNYAFISRTAQEYVKAIQEVRGFKVHH